MSKLSEISQEALDRSIACGEMKFDIFSEAVVAGCREGIYDAIESLPPEEIKIRDVESYYNSHNEGDIRDAAWQEGFNAARMRILQGLQDLLNSPSKRISRSVRPIIR